MIWCLSDCKPLHYSDVIMSAMAFEITGVQIVYSTVYSGADHRKHQNFEPLAFVRGIHRWPVDYLHSGPVTRKMFPFDDVIMIIINKDALHLHIKGSASLIELVETKWPPFCRHLQMQFLRWTLLYFDWNFTEVCSQWSSWQEANTGSDDEIIVQ